MGSQQDTDTQITEDVRCSFEYVLLEKAGT